MKRKILNMNFVGNVIGGNGREVRVGELEVMTLILQSDWMAIPKSTFG